MSHRFDATLKDILAQDPKDLDIPEFRLPKTLPARALNVDLSTISAATDLANLTGKLSYEAGGNRVEFQYDVVRMWQQPAERFLSGGLSLLPLATLCQLPEGINVQDGLRQIVREIDRRLAQEAPHAYAAKLMTAAFILTGMRVPKESVPAIYEGVGIMNETTAFDAIMDEGIAKGRAEGLVEGERNFLLRLGTKKFGAPGQETKDHLKAIHDLDRLDRLGEAILTATTWQELLATP